MINNIAGVCSIGESHASFNFRDCNTVKINSIDSITMHRVGRDKMDFSKWAIQNWICIFCFGEIDVRKHIYLQAQSGRDTIIPVVMSITPPNRIKDGDTYVADHELLPIGPNEDRARYCRIMNALLKAGCIERRLEFLDVYDKYADADGMLIYELSDGGFHIRNNKMVIEAMNEMLKTKFNYIP